MDDDDADNTNCDMNVTKDDVLYYMKVFVLRFLNDFIESDGEYTSY